MTMTVSNQLNRFERWTKRYRSDCLKHAIDFESDDSVSSYLFFAEWLEVISADLNGRSEPPNNMEVVLTSRINFLRGYLVTCLSIAPITCSQRRLF